MASRLTRLTAAAAGDRLVRAGGRGQPSSSLLRIKLGVGNGNFANFGTTRSSSSSFDVVNPYTEETIATVATDDHMSVVGKFVRASIAQKDWAAASLEHRVGCLHEFSRLLRSDSDAVAKTLTSEMGKPIAQAKAEVLGTCARVRTIADMAEAGPYTTPLSQLSAQLKRRRRVVFPVPLELSLYGSAFQVLKLS